MCSAHLLLPHILHLLPRTPRRLHLQEPSKHERCTVQARAARLQPLLSAAQPDVVQARASKTPQAIRLLLLLHVHLQCATKKWPHRIPDHSLRA